MSFFCEECNYKTNKKYNLTRHQNGKHIKKELKILNEDKHILNEDKHILNENKHILNENKHILNEDMHICKKCNKKYKTLKFLIEHEKKCNGLNILTCPKCMTIFSNTSNKSRHIKKNNCKAKSIIHLVNTDNDNDNDNKPSLFINGNNNNNNTINNTIINNFGNERTDYITFDDMINILKCGDNIIPKYIELKHFNKEFPENHNIKYEKNKGCLIKNNDRWGLTNLDIISNKLFDKNSYELRNYYNNQKKDIEEKIMNIEVLEFIYSRLNYLDLYLNKSLFNNIKNEIKNIIKYNMLF
jgi:uncharacterized C2H2 Zn-finger protein